MVALSALIGIVLGVGDLALSFEGPQAFFIGLTYIIGPSLILGAFLAVGGQHVIVVVLCGLALFLTRELTEVTFRLATTIDHSRRSLGAGELLWDFGVIGIESALVSLIALAGLGVVKLLVHVKESDGSECWRCLYQSNNPDASVCPECGRPLDESQCRFRWLHRFGGWCQRRRAWVRSAAAVAVLILFCAYVTVNRRSSPEADAFVARFRPIGKITAGFMRATPQSTPVAGLGAIINTSTPNLIVWVVYLPHDVPGLPSMQCVVQVRNGSFLGGESFTEAMPRVYCNFDRREADWVIAHGFPHEVIEALDKRSTPAMTIGPDVVIDPKTVLPREAWDEP